MDRDIDALGQFQWGTLRWTQLLDFMTEKQARTDIADGRFVRMLRERYGRLAIRQRDSAEN